MLIPRFRPWSRPAALALLFSAAVAPPGSAQSPPRQLTINFVAPQYRDARPPLPERAQIEVWLPENADLWFQEARTYQTGPRRLFTTPPLPAGQYFTYDVFVRWRDEGYERTWGGTVTVRGGDQVALDIVAAAQIQQTSATTIEEFPRRAAASTAPPPARVPPASRMSVTNYQAASAPRRLPGWMSVVEFEAAGGIRRAADNQKTPPKVAPVGRTIPTSLPAKRAP